MKKTITITIIVLVAVAFGYFLFKISPEQSGLGTAAQEEFDLSGVKQSSEPMPLRPTDHVMGNPEAKNVFIAYEDFQCPACAAYKNILEQVPNSFTDTKVVFRYFPLTRIHKNAVSAIYAAEAAGVQGKYWEMYDLIFETQKDWQDLSDPLDFYANLATQAGVGNIDQFKNEITSKSHKPRLQEDLVDALSLNLPGTPSFYFNGHKLEAGSLSEMKQQAEPFYIK